MPNVSNPYFHYPKHQITNKNAIVIGAGITGCSTAYALKKLGWDVTLVDKEGSIATKASGNKAAISSPLIGSTSDPIYQLNKLGFYFTKSLIKQLDVSKDYYLQTGLFEQNKTPSAATIKDLNIMITKEHYHYLNDSYVINIRSLCQELSRDINLITNSYISSLNLNSNSLWELVCDNQVIITAPVIIVCTAYQLDVIKNYISLPIIPVSGQICSIDSNIDIDGIYKNNGYITPYFNGGNHIGSTYRRHDSQADILDQDNETLLRNWSDILPKETVIKSSWAQVRGLSPDRRPVCGPVVNNADYKHYVRTNISKNKKHIDIPAYYNGLYINTAHGSRALSTAPILGQYIADLINGNQSILSTKIADLIHPSRFQLKQIRKEMGNTS